jgi:hypothetical protein
MDRYDFYHGQVVLESELDDAFDDVEDMERELAIESGVTCQADVAATPSSAICGGISSGLTVTGVAGNDFVTVALGKCRDDAGKQITLPVAATVKITHAGTTTKNETADVVGNGADLTGTCAAGDRIFASLFIAYEEQESTAITDHSGATGWYRMSESFKFIIEVGTSWTPPGALGSRASLANDKVLLADIVLTQNAGTGDMEVVAVCESTADFTALAGLYAALDGRRSDIFALDQAAVVWRSSGTKIRKNSVRDALYTLAVDYAQGIVQPPDGTYGRRYTPADYADAGSGSNHLTEHYADVAGTIGLRNITTQRGHVVRPHDFFDDFEIPSIADNKKWGLTTVQGNGTLEDYAAAGGCANLRTGASATTGDNLYLMSNMCWPLTAAPWYLASFRFMIPTLANQVFSFNLRSDDNNGIGIYLSTDNAGHGDTLYGFITSVGVTGSFVELGDISSGVFYTIQIAAKTANTAWMRFCSPSSIGAWTTVTGGGAAIVPGAIANLYITNYTTADAQAELILDQVFAGDGLLSADMY